MDQARAANVGQVTVEIKNRERVGDPREALDWLLRFVQADPKDLSRLFSGPGFAGFQYIGIKEKEQPLWAPPEIARLKRFHGRFSESVRAVLSGGGNTACRIPLPQRPASTWYLFPGLRSHFEGSWELGFLSRVNTLFARFAAIVRLCPGCSTIFVAKHGLQNYCSVRCAERHRQANYTAKRLDEIRALAERLGKPPTVAEIKKELSFESLAQARKFLNLANKEKPSDGAQTQRG